MHDSPQIEDTSLADVIRRNTDTAYIQDEVFVFYERHGASVAAEHPDKPQLVIGSAAGETLSGGVADDILVGRAGDDQLDGGSGGCSVPGTRPTSAPWLAVFGAIALWGLSRARCRTTTRS